MLDRRAGHSAPETPKIKTRPRSHHTVEQAESIEGTLAHDPLSSEQMTAIDELLERL